MSAENRYRIEFRDHAGRWQPTNWVEGIVTNLTAARQCLQMAQDGPGREYGTTFRLLEDLVITNTREVLPETAEPILILGLPFVPMTQDQRNGLEGAPDGALIFYPHDNLALIAYPVARDRWHVTEVPAAGDEIDWSRS